VAAVATASGTEPVVIGKPEREFVEMVLGMCGVTGGEALIVGDNLDTDIAAGVNAGVETVLMLTGVSQIGDVKKSDIKPDAVAADFNELKRMLF